jgi:xanthosine phosphorylase
MMPRDLVKDVQTAHDQIRQLIGERSPKIALMLGSGLGDLADQLDDAVTISYADISGFPVPTVKGHEGKLVFGTLNGIEVLFLKGRVHAYETDDFGPFKTLIRTVKQLGIETLFTTSSSGSLHADMPPGSIMVITDHINMMGVNPLTGPNDDEFGPRFPDMSDVWSSTLRETLKSTAKRMDINLFEGVYVGFRGPCFETHAEIHMARVIGGSAVGMSAVPENIIAHHCGLKVVGCAVITNLAAGMKDEKLSHDQTLKGAKLAYESLTKLIKSFVKHI